MGTQREIQPCRKPSLSPAQLLGYFQEAGRRPVRGGALLLQTPPAL